MDPKLVFLECSQDLTPKGVVALNSDLLVPNIWERYEDDLRIIEVISVLLERSDNCIRAF